MRSLVIGLTTAALMAGVSVAQTTTSGANQGSAAAPSTTHPAATTAPGNSTPGTTGTTGMPGTSTAPMSGTGPDTSNRGTAATPTAPNPNDKAAASGDSNQAVATTGANADQPAKGSNSFTEGQAKSRLQDNGFSDVSDLKKDDDGIWRGTATKNGQKTHVWLDYKGNSGQSTQ